MQHVAHQLDDIVGHGGGEQHRLALACGSMRHDLAHVADEAHVQHAVGFIDDEGRHRVQPDMLLLHQVEQAARGGDQDVDAMLGGVDLGILADAAQDHRQLEIEEAAIGAQALLDLHRQFAGRRQDQRLGLARAAAAHGRWKASAAAAGRKRRSCRCRSGRCPAGRGPPAAPGWPGPGWGWDGCNFLPPGRAGSARQRQARQKSRQSRKVLKNRENAPKRRGATAVAVFHAHWRERRFR